MKLEPYFLKNKEWYYWDEGEFCFKLREDAPQEAVDSYVEFYREEIDENGRIIR